MMFILGAFLTGGAVGFAADRVASPPRPDVFSESAMVDELARELKLAPEQRVVIDSVWDWRRTQSREIMKSVRPTLDAVRDSARVLMMNTLDEAQKTAFRALLERNQRTADSAARARGETK
ncbi:hypothetical protein [Gemmatimonas sp.]|jgi:hypothetical protein|uniref:hypothetical protein n=1 Tax=Gemmatimonas sp. TaxID=1962908 RepID=UPI0037BFEE39